ncbi:ABC transporter ATP-binding protein [Salmonella bongori]|uniref:sn-glycerol-3-phosphate ABC transporter ATP-binding protein UgpC n=3 Tax=Salmonella TaxID=590 RepID=A0A750P4A5_SALER|nr:sn-glycerol-3-phosphate ABC transporter ATP-binding protein UgpC [Salmonella bongori]ECG8259832.1 sn-glycerol-3-phosphate ABC transporter ATP-binding protein UgpC [Salmonella bongori serovar 48:i:-]EGE4653818.1 sn-glycerol-3-phosphate ABC transporter ATP-binding protein UgpC [Salmonella bongori serovar 40:z35:- str. 95-0123]EGS1128664.1 sn-glycerol-3-phosphate ABC transporter ATP-binding protein UgpC [Salmonella bongori CFSAN000509]HAC6694275.1 sn-glycerol-3-phosphate ABC transporter ATP-bin
MSQIVLNNLGKSYGNVNIIKGISLDIHEGEFIVLVGPSGCGKSTLLRMIAGLEDITSGELLMHGKIVNTLPAKKRDIAMVFQSYALYPHMKVRDNMSFALRLANVSKSERMAKVEQAAEILGLTHLLDRLPRELSGGQRQRVAMGRALVRDPKAFLFDEPLSNLDAKLRHKMRGEIRKIHQRMGRTTIYVTHDQTEAMTMADRIVVLNAGHIEQVGTPEALYRNPDNLFVAGFIGTPEINTIKGVIQNGDIVLHNGYRFPCPLSLPTEGREIICAVRPHHIRLSDSGMPAEIVLIEMTGEGQEIQARSENQELIMVSHEKQGMSIGEKVWLDFDATNVFLFDAQSGERLRS